MNFAGRAKKSNTNSFIPILLNNQPHQIFLEFYLQTCAFLQKPSTVKGNIFFNDGSFKANSPLWQGALQTSEKLSQNHCSKDKAPGSEPSRFLRLYIFYPLQYLFTFFKVSSRLLKSLKSTVLIG